MPSSITHLVLTVLTVLPVWGHVRPLCALAGRLVRENNHVAITILLAPNWITQADAEFARQFPAGSDKIRVVSLFASAETQFTNLFPPHAAAYPAAYAKLVREETITCATTGTTFKALPAPTALIADKIMSLCEKFFAIEQVKATRAITGEQIPIFSFASCCAASIIRMLGPENMGGRGDLKARAEAEAQRTGKDAVEIGEQIFKHTEGKILQLPGLPAVYDFEFCPQKFHLRRPYIRSSAVHTMLSVKVTASGFGMLTPWCPQQFILNHPATSSFMGHCGHGGVSEALATGTQKCNQPEAALHLTHNLSVAFNLIEVRTGKGLLPLISGRVPQGTRAAVGSEIRGVIDDCRGSVGEEKRRNAQRMRAEYARAWEEGGSARAVVGALLKKVT
ncbi:hypothetical protein C8J57DRAFT_1577725 [Mycena rebaudengoi]|nr:hypothetical protein C8J57DRAFT_1577725 [Mycena rebaudengoi]